LTGGTLLNHPERALPGLILTTCPREASPPASFRFVLGFVLVFFILISPYRPPETEEPHPARRSRLRPGPGHFQALAYLTLEHLE
jgi:hypothetical protein